MSYQSGNDRTAMNERNQDFHGNSRLERILYGDHSTSRQIQQIVPVPRPPPRYASRAQTNSNARRVTGVVQAPQIDAVWIPNISKSVIIDMKLGITEDVDQELEEISRLRRLGNFKAAQRFLKQQLPGRSDDPYFFVLYAQLLFEMGDFRSFDMLRPTRVFGAAQDEAMQKNQDLLRQSWNLLILMAMLPGRDCADRAIKEIDRALALLETLAGLGSTEIQILTIIFRLIGYLAHTLGIQSLQLRDAKNLAKEWTDWATVYHCLASEGRVWDFRDIFTAFKRAFGQDQAFNAFFNTGSVDEIMETLGHDWETGRYDESTNLALLDIISSLILESDFEKTPSQYFQTCLEHGEKLVKPLMSEDPEATKSRPFARWLVAKAAVLSCSAHDNPFSSFRFLDEYPGMQLRQGDGIHVPVYVPLRSERPTWHVPLASREWEDAVRFALTIAKDLADYKTQALCLKHLIVRSQEPQHLLEELSHLQNSIQDDQDGYLRTCLSKLLILTDSDSQRGLAEELFRFGRDEAIINQKLPIEHHNLSLQWARNVILPTLPAIAGGNVTVDKSGPFYARLPAYIRQFIDVRETFHSQSKPMNPFPDRNTKLRQWAVDNIVEEEIERSTRLVPEPEAMANPGIRRVQTLADDAGSDRRASRYEPATRRKIDKQNENISKRRVSVAMSSTQPSRLYNDTTRSVSRSEVPSSRDSDVDTNEAAVLGPVGHEVPREETSTAEGANANETRDPSTDAEDVPVRLDEVSRDQRPGPEPEPEPDPGPEPDEQRWPRPVSPRGKPTMH
ncbi:hypothetical protein SAMD00023353_0503280 [Rosellinia necatrix]|uniref:Uncharacterized protein n=1 Tax=Rosellinia necatrix TaxID=77044 RepID=A0A1S7ULH4_ROSNE|nr:hypothetical protein SAMD00023353_0503280 [Rosellinia necatrix]